MVFPIGPVCWIGVRITVMPGRICPPPARTYRTNQRVKTGQDKDKDKDQDQDQD